MEDVDGVDEDGVEDQHRNGRHFLPAEESGGSFDGRPPPDALDRRHLLDEADVEDEVDHRDREQVELQKEGNVRDFQIQHRLCERHQNECGQQHEEN